MKANLASCKPQLGCFRSVLTTQAKQALKPIAVGSPAKHNHKSYDNRRQILLSGVLGTVAMCTTCEVSAIPLAPLGKRSDKVGGDKLQMPTVDQVKVRRPILIHHGYWDMLRHYPLSVNAHGSKISRLAISVPTKLFPLIVDAPAAGHFETGFS